MKDNFLLGPTKKFSKGHCVSKKKSSAKKQREVGSQGKIIKRGIVMPTIIDNQNQW